MGHIMAGGDVKLDITLIKELTWSKVGNSSIFIANCGEIILILVGMVSLWGGGGGGGGGGVSFLVNSTYYTQLLFAFSIRLVKNTEGGGRFKQYSQIP